MNSPAPQFALALGVADGFPRHVADAMAQAWRDGLAPLAPVRLAPAPDWARAHYRLPARSSSVEGAWESHAWQADLLLALTGSAIPICTVVKSTQLGLTKLLVIVGAYHAIGLRRSVIVYLPTDGDATVYCKEEMDPAFRECPTFQAALTHGPKANRGNSIGYKELEGATWHVRGGKSATSYRQVSAHLVVYDDADGFPVDVDGEGDPFALGDRRVEASYFSKSIRVSTPTLKGGSLIERESQASEVVLRRHVACRACGGLAPIRWRALRWRDGDPDSVRWHCPHCDHPHHNGELAALDQAGAWRSDDGLTLRDGRLCDDTGAERRVASAAFRLWAAYSYHKPWSRTVREFLAAKRALRAGDAGPMKTWTNTARGEAWESPAERIDGEQLAARRADISETRIPDDVGALVLACDVSAHGIDWELTGWGAEQECYGLAQGRMVGDTARPAVYDQILDYAQRDRATVSGHALEAPAIIIDASYHQHYVTAWAARHRDHPRLYVIKGHPEPSAPMIGLPSTRNRHRVPIYRLGVHDGKKVVLARLRIAEPGPGYCHFSESYPERWFEGYSAERLEVKVSGGHYAEKWVQHREWNEPLDLRVYALCALYLWRPRIVATLAQRDGGAAGPQPIPATQTPRRARRPSRPARSVRTYQRRGRR